MLLHLGEAAQAAGAIRHGRLLAVRRLPAAVVRRIAAFATGEKPPQEVLRQGAGRTRRADSPSELPPHFITIHEQRCAHAVRAFAWCAPRWTRSRSLSGVTPGRNAAPTHRPAGQRWGVRSQQLRSLRTLPAGLAEVSEATAQPPIAWFDAHPRNSPPARKHAASACLRERC